MSDYSVLSEDKAKTPIRFIIVMYALVKTVFYLIALSGTQTLPRVGVGVVALYRLGFSTNYIPLISRVITGAIMVAVTFLLTGNKKLAVRYKSLFIPLAIVVIELTYLYLFGGDRITYIFLIGCSILSLMYADVLGLAVFMTATTVITAFVIFVLKVRLLGAYYASFNSELFNFLAMVAVYGLVFILGRYSVNALGSFRQAGYIFDTLLKTSPNFIVVVNDKARVEYISKSFVELVGIDKPEYAKRLPFIDLFPTAELKYFWNGLLQIEDAFTETFEMEFDGVKRYFSISSETLGDSKVARTFDCVDVTSIVEAHKAAEAASKSKSSFLATMSHEIRTPMNAIIGIAQLQLQRGDLPDDYANALEKIYASGGSLLGIINDILDMSKIETGKMELHPVEYDTPSLINDAVQLNIVRIGAKEIEFVVDIDENLPSRLYGDELRIKQILNNLLSNAIKYTAGGRVRLSVNHSIDDDNDNSMPLNDRSIMLSISVEDTGQGMKPEDRDRLFSAYQRFNAEANRATEGTGLGLNITKKLVDMMDGTISVESEYGQGSTFTIIVKQKAVECPVIGADVVKQLREFSFTGGRQAANLRITYEPMPYGNVLVVDDVSSNLYVAEGLLALYKLNVETVDSGFAAIKKTEDGKVYDVIFMDHMMPEMDGIETTHKLRALGYTGAIVALTANALVGNEEMFRENGFDGFISKPIDIRQLNATVTKFIRDRHPEEAEKYKSGGTEYWWEDSKNNVDISPAGGLDSVVTERSRSARPPAMASTSLDHQAVIERPPAVIERSRDVARNPQLLKYFCNDARKAVITLRETVDKGNIKLFTITAHAMKSALANVGETEASGAALALETAGHGGDMGFISANIDGFIQTLESLLKKFGQTDSVDTKGTDNTAEDTDYLIEQLKIIKNACDNYDDDTAYAALDRLKERRWKSSTTKSLEQIRDALFTSSDFEGAAGLCGTLLG